MHFTACAVINGSNQHGQVISPCRASLPAGFLVLVAVHRLHWLFHALHEKAQIECLFTNKSMPWFVCCCGHIWRAVWKGTMVTSGLFWKITLFWNLLPHLRASALFSLHISVITGFIAAHLSIYLSSGSAFEIHGVSFTEREEKNLKSTSV